MSVQPAAPVGESTEEGRAFLQERVALFWKVLFFIVLLSSVLGAAGAVASPGIDLFVTFALTGHAGLCWWLCARGARSARFSRAVEAGGLLVSLGVGALLNRFLLASVERDHAITTVEGALMADGYVSMLQQAGSAMMVAIRAALVPSTPRRTAIVTTLVGIPMIVVTTVLVPDGHGWVALRDLAAGDYRFLPGSHAMMWAFAVITSTVISWVIYGLRAEVREARRLGQYVLEEKIGEGGMGEVYRARHGMMRRPAALKLVRAELAGEAQVRRFECEVQLTAGLSHPNTITIYDYGRTNDGIFYYVMELLDGANLQRVVAIDGAQPAGRVVRIMVLACRALAEAHGQGLIHRDIKPANIMLCTKGGETDVVKVLDFGLVKELSVEGDAALTGAAALTGTPLYMAPESITTPDAVDERTDVYALGAVAYFLLTGTEVFTGKSIVEVLSQHLHKSPEPMSSRGAKVPADLEALVMACLAKEPDARPRSAAELGRRLEACAVEPWDAENAREWWSEHRAAIEARATASAGDARTIKVAGR